MLKTDKDIMVQYGYSHTINNPTRNTIHSKKYN